MIRLSSLRNGLRRSAVLPFVWLASEDLVPAASLLLCRSQEALGCRWLRKGMTRGVNRGNESIAEQICANGKHKASMAKKACNRGGAAASGSALALGTGPSRHVIAPAGRVDPRKVGKRLVSGQTLSHGAGRARRPSQSFQAFLVNFSTRAGAAYQNRARKSTP